MGQKIKARLTLQNLIIFLILGIALFLRIYIVEALLGFYYDQGREA